MHLPIVPSGHKDLLDLPRECGSLSASTGIYSLDRHRCDLTILPTTRGIGGDGGGGTGGYSSDGISGSINKGGGGGGAGYNGTAYNNSGMGGSGIVIVRYQLP